jgi:hypothetical protein
MPIASRFIVRPLAALAIFGALSAFGGAVLGIAANGGGVPVEHLAGSPFTSYIVPSLILGVIVGGTQAAAALSLLVGHRKALFLSAVAGFGMLIWIFTELAIIRQYSWLQSAYFALGTLELVGVLALLGVVPALVVPFDEPSRAR